MSRIASYVATIATLSVITLCTSLSLSAQPERDARFAPLRRTLVGTWRVAITPRVCQSGAAIREPFPAMATFSFGGTMTTADSALNPAQRSAGHGVWRHENSREYRAVAEAFLFNAGGTWVGIQRLTQTIELSDDGNSFRATVAATFLDAAGNVTGSGCATTVGQRLLTD